MHLNNWLRLLSCLLFALFCQTQADAGSNYRKKYPGGKYYFWRYTLKDKQGTSYSIDHPSRWLTHKSIERRKRQGLQIDSTALPVSARYLRQIESILSAKTENGKKSKAEWTIIGTSRWNNTVLIRSNDTTLLSRLKTLDCISKSQCVWISPDSTTPGIQF